MDTTQDPSSSTTSIKRKADQAFDALDDALRPREGRPSPPKRVNTSIYSSLEKFGIINRSSSTPKPSSTPTLTALLSRARTRKNRKPLSITQYAKASSVTPEYSPGSTEVFLQRLSTFNFSTYPSKPPQIDAVAASKAGWINEGGKDRLYCAICKVGWVVAGRDGMNKDAANALIEKQRHFLVTMHKDGCPWRVRQCDPLVYRIPLQSPANLARQIKTRAIELEPVTSGIAIRHPLGSNQVQTFVQTVSVSDQSSMSPPSPTPSPENSVQPPASQPSTVSLLTSLFGWSLVSSPPPLARKSSSASLALARSHSRASSVQSHAGSSRDFTPVPRGLNAPVTFNTPAKGGPTTPFGTPFGTPVSDKGGAHDVSALAVPPVLTSPSRVPPLQKDAMLHCQMCQRRIGLWAFAAPDTPPNGSLADSQSNSSQNAAVRPQRQLDLLREHRSYCPYVVKSTPLASLPSYPPPPPSATPRSSFNLTRTGTSPSVGEAQNTSSAFDLRRTTSLLASASSHIRTGSLGSGAEASASELQDRNLVEGWRAVYNTVLRFGMSERSRVKVQLSGPQSSPGAESTPEHGGKNDDDAMSGVVELVEGVKRHGGKQLLSYVRSLLG